MTALKILVIDDSPEDQLTYKRFLKRAFPKIDFTVVSTGYEGIKHIQMTHFDCILLDYNLPDINGVNFLNLVKELPNSLIPIIVLTGQGNESVAVEVLKLGATDYLVKSEIAEGMLRQAILNAIAKVDLARQLKRQEEQIKYIAYHDHLTGLPNRLNFEELSTLVLSNAQEKNSEFAIIMTDLDRFKQINDSLGHNIGDILLQQLAHRFSSVLSHQDSISRFGGDEFIILVNNINEIDNIANAITQTLQEPFILSDQSITVTVSQGIAVYPCNGQTISDLVRNADIAMYQAKFLGKNVIQYFQNDNLLSISNNLILENAIRHGMLQNEFYLEYQPVIDLATNSLYAVEAVLRWSNPKFKGVKPLKIIRVCEESGIIQSLGNWITNAALHQLDEWQKKYPTLDVKLSVNLSPLQLDYAGWFKATAELFTHYTINPKQVIFELTETAVTTNFEKAKQQINALSDMGCDIYIDDFGTGHSSLNLLRDLPISGLKIDKSFIDSIVSNNKHRIIVNLIIDLAEKLDIILVVEGIETHEQLEIFKQYPKIKAQGYYLAYPMNANKIISTYLNE